MLVYIIVFEDNVLEMVDANCIFTSKQQAEKTCKNYSHAYYNKKNDRKLIVRSMNLSIINSESKNHKTKKPFQVKVFFVFYIQDLSLNSTLV